MRYPSLDGFYAHCTLCGDLHRIAESQSDIDGWSDQDGWTGVFGTVVLEGKLRHVQDTTCPACSRKPLPKTKVCPRCGEGFVPTRISQLFCDLNCRVAYMG